ncbi:MAG: tyrosine-type recombinase/integrase [Desulfobacterales bacterium]|nr:tyrosine-type recombinase/integrase [Desulfobacterales bacterium]
MKHFKSFLAPQLRDFIAYRQNLGYAKRTLMSHLLTFDRYLKEQKTAPDLLQPPFFLELRKDLKLEPRSANGILSTVRVFFQFMVRRGYYVQNPVKDVPPLAESAIIPFVFSPEQTNQLLGSVCKRLSKIDHYFLTDLAIYTAIVLMARCGMRISEPLRLLRSHWRPAERTVYIEKTKFKKDRLIPVPEPVAVEIENYLAVRNALLCDDQNPYLLAGKNQKPLRDHQVRRRFHRAVKDIGLSQHRLVIGNMNFSAPTPHSLRHSFAVNTLRRIKKRGKSPQNALPVLATYMGHSEYKHTMKYLKVIDAEQRQGLANFVSSHHGQL